METFDNEFEIQSLNRPVLAADENILWSGKPKKNALIASHALTMMPIAILWLCLAPNTSPPFGLPTTATVYCSPRLRPL